VLERAIVLNTGHTIHDIDLSEIPNDSAFRASETDISIPLKQWLGEKEKQYLTQRLNDLGGNVGLIAKSCRIGVRTLSRKINQYGLDKLVSSKRTALITAERIG
jgi:DNA-binding NtrC family response regulator